MITVFSLGWIKNVAPISKTFKLEGTKSLFEEYTQRISHYSECKIGPLPREREAGSQLWICNSGAGTRMLSSEELGQKLEKVRDSGIRKLFIVIGDADGFTPHHSGAGFTQERIEKLKPDFQWSFGPMTLPHELAAVVAAEQIYRAWTILHGLPYHRGH